MWYQSHSAKEGQCTGTLGILWHRIFIIPTAAFPVDHCILTAYLIPNKYVSFQRLLRAPTERFAVYIIGVYKLYSTASVLVDMYQPQLVSLFYGWIVSSTSNNIHSFSERGSSWQSLFSCSRFLTAITVSRIPDLDSSQLVGSILYTPIQRLSFLP